MRCRKIINGELVFFNSSGINSSITDSDKQEVVTGNKELLNYPGTNFVEYNEDGSPISNSYAWGINAVAESLTQRLSLIRGELPHFMSAGFPLTSKETNKSAADAYVINTVFHCPDVIGIKNLSSKIQNHNYIANIVVETVYGDLNLTSSQTTDSEEDIQRIFDKNK